MQCVTLHVLTNVITTDTSTLQNTKIKLPDKDKDNPSSQIASFMDATCVEKRINFVRG